MLKTKNRTFLILSCASIAYLTIIPDAWVTSIFSFLCCCHGEHEPQQNTRIMGS
jgi:hypothetical protein